MKKYVTIALIVLGMSLCVFWLWPHNTPSKFEKIIYESTVLQKNMPINIYLPKDYKPGNHYPVLYLIHGFGLGDDENQWLSDIVKVALLDQLIEEKKIAPTVVISPKVDASCGYNTGVGAARDDVEKGFSYGQYETYFIEEMMPYVEERYGIKISNGQRMVGGFSGGGTAALYYAFKYEGLFGKVGAFCPALYTDDVLKATPEIETFLYGSKTLRAERDPISLASHKTLEGLDIIIETPEFDRWVKGSVQLHELLVDRGITHTFGLEVNSHSPRGVREYIQRYLQFFSPPN